ncbi:membrane dipeptidase [Brevibacillus formosus]|nr:membrane dipeptidase [Brevibacillus sp. NRRL NRS-603]MED1943532.1 membrane dipeptidase [Brevibacillus formosus]MED2000096.1 membrane dipeptidase [Brevibacillus formosus]MED2081767.1 membrane dipeptidase [Brevibacillus formosus]
MQVLACFVPSQVPFGRRFHTVLEMIDIFYQKVASDKFRPIFTKGDLAECVLKGQKGAILFVEGAHALEESLVQLRTWFRLGVRGMTLTWNHGNALASGNHSRNLTDEQIQALIANDGAIGLTFVDFFTVSEKRKVWIDDLLLHLDHICALGGVDHVGFGSDFDGITETFGDMHPQQITPSY